MTLPPNNRVESNRCGASRLRRWEEIGGSFRGCHGALTAAVARPSRSEELRFPDVKACQAVLFLICTLCGVA